MFSKIKHMFRAFDSKLSYLRKPRTSWLTAQMWGDLLLPGALIKTVLTGAQCASSRNNRHLQMTWMNFCSKLENILAAQLLMSYRALTRGQMRRAGKDVLSINRGVSPHFNYPHTLWHFQNLPALHPFLPFLLSFNQLRIRLSKSRIAGVKTTLTRCPPHPGPSPSLLILLIIAGSFWWMEAGCRP